MKFYCDNCQTKYSISDDKVRGKVLKVRCKKCSHIITVREPVSPAVAGAGTGGTRQPRREQPGMPPPRAVEWHYSVNGQSFGPFTEAAVAAKFESGELGDAVYLWNESFPAWKPASEVSTFARALQAGRLQRKPSNTLAVSKALEAINREEVEAPSAGEGESEVESSAPLVDAGEEAAERQQDRLQALRSRLRLDEEPEEAASEGDSFDKEPSNGATIGSSTHPDVEIASTGADQSASFAPGREAGEEELATSDTLPERPENHDGLFSGHDSDVLSAQAQQEAKESEEDQVPFFASAPKLGKEKESSKSRMEEVTGSLLIQLNAIKSDGRKRAIFTAIIAVLAVATVGAVGYYGFTQRNEVEEDDRPRIGAGNVGQAPEFRRYSEEERARAQVILGEELVISREDSRAAYQAEEESSEGTGGGTGAGRRVTAPRIDPSAFRAFDEDDGATRAIDDGAQATGGRFQRVGLAGIGEEGQTGLSAGRSGALAGANEDLGDDRLNAMARLQTDTQRGVYNPRDEFSELVGKRERLTSGDIAQGMQNVMASVGSCRERHILRGGTIEHDRVEVTLNIEPTGRVGEFSLSPSALRDTDFGRCMTSHTGRWRFPPFESEAIEIRTPFLLQD